MHVRRQEVNEMASGIGSSLDNGRVTFGPSEPHVETEAVDPVCGRQIERAHAEGRIEYASRHYFFCSRECQERFEAAPERYATVD